jgi:hypothetical protein
VSGDGTTRCEGGTGGVFSLLLGTLLGSTPGVSAQSAAPTGAAAGGRGAGPSGAPLGRAPSMYETGRVGTMSIHEPGVQIRQTSGRSQPPREQRIDAKTSAPPAPAPAGGKIIDQAAFDRALQERFARLRACKLEVARQRRSTPGALAGSRLILRWTILPDGHVADTRVVAVARVDGRVADCIKREMSQWAFDPPRGGPAVVERPFRFAP